MAYNHKVDGSVVKWIDIFLLGILGLFALAFFPQMLNALRSRSQWGRGLVLYRTKTATPDDSSSITARNSRDQPSVDELKGSRRGVPHVKSLSTRFFPLAKILRLPLPFPCYTVGKGLLVLLYFGTLLFAALYRDSVFKNPTREGAIVASQLPWVYILATKNNTISVLTRRGFEKLNYLHRNAGTLTVLAANVHAIGFIYKWVINGTWTKDIQEPWIRWGLVALVAMDILFFFSLTFIRRNYYNVFYVSHCIALVVLLFAICLHQPFAIPYVAIASGFYGADHVLRLVKTRTARATLEAVPDLHTTLVRVPALTAGWRAGQFVRVRVLSRGMGWFGWSEPHAFTVASVCGGGAGADGMLLMVKRSGRWTRKLYALASAPGETKDERNVRVLVEGPYGGPGFTDFASFSGALFVCGGSGITFGLSAVQEVLQRAAQGTSNVRTVRLVWCAPHARALAPLLDCFASMLGQASALATELTIHVCYTRALPQDDKSPGPDALPRGLALAPGRAHVPQLLDAFVARTQAVLAPGGRAHAHGVLLGVCGPAGLAQDARAAIAALDAEDRRAVGGVEFHDEAFHW